MICYLEFYEGVNKGLQTAKQGPEWTVALADCFNTVQGLTTSKDGIKIVQNLFNLCDPLNPSDSSDIASLFINLASFFSNAVLFNNIATGSGFYNTIVSS